MSEVLSIRSLPLRAIFLALGFTAIGPLALAYAEILPLPVGGRFILLPAAAAVACLCMYNREWGRRAMVGYVSGIVATFIYDCLRWSLTFGYPLFPADPIPGIGRLLLNDPHAFWIWGYVWRFLGNGAGMGLAYAMLPWRGVKTGIAYGVTICFGLFGVLYFFPVAQEHFFPLLPNTMVGALLGHIVYGAVLGKLSSDRLPPVRWPGRARSERGVNTARPAASSTTAVPLSQPVTPLPMVRPAPVRPVAQPVAAGPVADPGAPEYVQPVPVPPSAISGPIPVVPLTPQQQAAQRQQAALWAAQQQAAAQQQYAAQVHAAQQQAAQQQAAALWAQQAAAQQAQQAAARQEQQLAPAGAVVPGRAQRAAAQRGGRLGRRAAVVPSRTRRHPPPPPAPW
jgi:hypothetical protein